ncbi:MAG: tetratricopeptide repeat protein [Desulfobacterales bacterium]|nr:tetratricopeptide repeat protein [Desulfobacterales bacterium]
MQPVQMKDRTHFLIVDDQQLVLTLANRILRTNGYKNIQQAKNGIDALNKLRKQPTDILITDWDMPRMNGIELLSTIRKDPNLCNISVLMVSEEMSDDKILYAIEEGVDAYQEKPFSEQELIQNIHKIMEKELEATSLKYELQKLTAMRLRKRYDSAIEFGQNLLVQHPNSIDVYIILSECYMNQMQIDLAKETLQKALKINPNSSKIYHMLGKISLKEGKYDEAISQLERSYSLNPLNTSAAIDIGYAYLQMGKIKEATETFGTLQDKNLTDMNCSSIGAAYLGVGNLEKAGKYLEQAKMPIKETIGIFNRYALELKKKGKYTEAIDQYSKCLKIDPSNHIILLNLAICYCDIKNFQEAENYLNKCIKIEPNYEDANRLLQHIKGKIRK